MLMVQLLEHHCLHYVVYSLRKSLYLSRIVLIHSSYPCRDISLIVGVDAYDIDDVVRSTVDR